MLHFVSLLNFAFSALAVY